MLNQIHPSIRMEYEFDGKTRMVVAKMLLVVAPKGTKLWVGAGGRLIAFGYNGDSGSPVYDYSGKRLGMYVGGQTMAKHNNPSPPSVDGLHFVTPLGPTVEDILTTLRGDPGFAGCNLEIDTEWEAPDELQEHEQDD